MKRQSALIIGLISTFCSLSLVSWAFDVFSAPQDPPSSAIINIKLNSNDLPSGAVFEGQIISRHYLGAGWSKGGELKNWDDLNPGLRDSWKIDNGHFRFHYGYFQTPEKARSGAFNDIELSMGPEANPVTRQHSIAFSGRIIGDNTYSWTSNEEKSISGLFATGPNNQAFTSGRVSMSLNKGQYAFEISVGKETIYGPIDLNFLEAIALKVVRKIDVGSSLDNFFAELPRLVTHQGILRSLQAKLDVFIKNYQKGEYKTALNNISSFINELAAQRGKHVSESAYQTLKGYADIIVQSLNSLM